jgi:(p)ppGpp synthase/HD superfamily hydrolase
MNVTRLLQALDFAAHKHRGQRRKSREGVPYINHPIRAARLLAEMGGRCPDVNRPLRARFAEAVAEGREKLSRFPPA